MKILNSSKVNATDMVDAIKLLGFDYLEMEFYRRIESINSNSQLIMYCELLYDDTVKFSAYLDANKIDSETFNSPIKLIDHIEDLLKSYKLDNIKLIPLDSSIIINGKKIFAKTTTRDFAKKLSRVKSSNIWSYAFNPKDYNKGDLLMQFKGGNGGPADIYIYYDVPSKIWRRFVAAPSKGHFFWENIRNIYKYAKLTGDKRTKLPNGL